VNDTELRSRGTALVLTSHGLQTSTLPTPLNHRKLQQQFVHIGHKTASSLGRHNSLIWNPVELN